MDNFTVKMAHHKKTGPVDQMEMKRKRERAISIMVLYGRGTEN